MDAVDRGGLQAAQQDVTGEIAEASVVQPFDVVEGAFHALALGKDSYAMTACSQCATEACNVGLDSDIARLRQRFWIPTFLRWPAEDCNLEPHGARLRPGPRHQRGRDGSDHAPGTER